MSQLIERYAKQYPVVSIVGPRQVGKSTLVKSLFPDLLYYNLENPSLLMQIRDDQGLRMKSTQSRKIIDL
jgi:predicted AAA+ superfamily ATPase